MSIQPTYTKQVEYKLSSAITAVPHDVYGLDTATVSLLQGSTSPASSPSPQLSVIGFTDSSVFVYWSNFAAGRECVALLALSQTADTGGGDYVDVTDYGAIGDGTTNDGPAIQTAIDAAVAAGGGVVYFPAGTYKSTAKLTCGVGVHLKGDGYKVSKLLFDLDAATDCIWFHSGTAYGNGGGIQGLEIYTASQADCQDIVSLVQWGPFRMQDCRLANAGRYGVYIEDGIDTDLESVVIAGAKDAGLYTTTAGGSVTTTVRAKGCYFSGTTHGPGADVAGLQIVLESCIFESNGQTGTAPGFRMRSGHVSLLAPYFENNAGHEMDVGTVNVVNNHFHCSNPFVATGAYNQSGYATLNADYLAGGQLIGGKVDLRTKSVVLTSNSAGFQIINPALYTGAKTPEFDAAGSRTIRDYPAPTIIGDGDTGDGRIFGRFLIESAALQPASIPSGVTKVYAGSIRTAWTKVTIPKDVWVAAALQQGYQLGSIPAKSKIRHVIADTTEAFAGGGLGGTIQLSVGTAVAGTNLLVAHDVKTAPVTAGLVDADLGANINRAAAVAGGHIFSWSATTPIYVTLTSGAGNLGNGAVTNLTNGTVTLYIELELLA